MQVSWTHNYSKLLIKNIENDILYYIHGCVEKKKKEI